MLNPSLLENFRKHDLCLVMHVGNRTRLLQGIGGAVSIARVNQHASAGFFGQLRRKILPVRDRAESFMKHYDRGKGWLTRLNPGGFQLVTVDKVAMLRHSGQWHAPFCRIELLPGLDERDISRDRLTAFRVVLIVGETQVLGKSMKSRRLIS